MEVQKSNEPDRNTDPTQGLPHRLKSPSVQHPHCARDAHFLAMAFCAGVRMGSACEPDCPNYLKSILKKGAGFEEAYTFEHGGLTCLLLPFKEGMAIDMGKLAMWRLQTHAFA